jgi:hypothetical protein
MEKYQSSEAQVADRASNNTAETERVRKEMRRQGRVYRCRYYTTRRLDSEAAHVLVERGLCRAGIPVGGFGSSMISRPAVSRGNAGAYGVADRREAGGFAKSVKERLERETDRKAQRIEGSLESVNKSRRRETWPSWGIVL